MKIFEKKKEGNRRIFYIFGKKVLSYKKRDKNIEYYRSLGVKIGNGTQFIVYPKSDNHPNFGSEPFLIEIGENCLISFGVTFLTHDGSRKICLKFIEEADRKDLVTWQKIKIGNNVFIGCNSIIMPGVTIGDDAVIGAESVVTKDIPNSEVWAGNPARFIRTTQSLAQKFVDLNNTKKMKDLKIIHKEQLKKIKRVGD